MVFSVLTSMRNQLSRFSNVGPDSLEHLYPRCTDLDERMIRIFFTLTSHDEFDRVSESVYWLSDHRAESNDRAI
jgi:hypothetical protein